MPRPKKSEVNMITEEQENEQESVEFVPTAKKNSDTVSEFDESEFYQIEMVEVSEKDEKGNINYRIEKQTKWNPKNPNYRNSYMVKNRARTAQRFNVPIEQVERAYSILNSKLIDRVPVNEIIDRYGWSDGKKLNRQQLAEKYNVSIASLDIAEQKLSSIIRMVDIQKAYLEYVREFEHEHGIDLIRNVTGI